MWRVTRKFKMTDRKEYQHVSSIPLPYTTKTGVQIGIAYQRPPQQLTYDGEIIQSALLGVRSFRFMSSGSIWYYTCLVILFIILAVVVGK